MPVAPASEPPRSARPVIEDVIDSHPLQTRPPSFHDLHVIRVLDVDGIVFIGIKADEETDIVIAEDVIAADIVMAPGKVGDNTGDRPEQFITIANEFIRQCRIFELENDEVIDRRRTRRTVPAVVAQPAAESDSKSNIATIRRMVVISGSCMSSG